MNIRSLIREAIEDEEIPGFGRDYSDEMKQKEEIVEPTAIYYDLNSRTARYVIEKYSKEEIEKAIEKKRNSIFARNPGNKRSDYQQRIWQKDFDEFNKGAREIENMLKGKPSEEDVRKVRSQVMKIVRFLNLPISKEYSTSARGWHSVDHGFKVTAEPYYHPYETVEVNYLRRYGASNILSRDLFKAIDEIENRIKALGYETHRENPTRIIVAVKSSL